MALQEWVALLREMALNFTTIPALSEYKSLVNTDVEADFFYNIVHLQVAISSISIRNQRLLFLLSLICYLYSSFVDIRRWRLTIGYMRGSCMSADAVTTPG